MPPALKIFETVLYADDLVAAERFYRKVLGLGTVQTCDLFITLRCGDGYLLVFDRRKSEEKGRQVPSHGASGPGHLAFSVEPRDLEMWWEHLKAMDVEIEHDVDWRSGGRSIYFRDPAGNSLELAPPELWDPRSGKT